MGTVFEVAFSVFIFVSTLCLINASEDFKDDGLDRGADSGLWFGPRLGKRSLQLNDEDKSETYLKLLEAADILKYYYDEMPSQMETDASEKVTKNIPKLKSARGKYGRRKLEHYDFTPRLGRRLPEKVVATPPKEDIIISDPVITYPRKYIFTPRVGRNYDISPQLGRELYELYPDPQTRIARSINKTKSD